MRSLNIAHRGIHSEYPENTLEAFLQAWSSGCDMVEFDIQLSKEGVPVLFHDDDLVRLCNINKAVYECTVSELQGYRLLQSSAVIPTLEEFMRIGADRPHYFELKVPQSKKNDREYKEKLVDSVYHYLSSFAYLTQSYVCSFDPQVFEIIHDKKYYSDNLVITFEFEKEIEHYAESQRKYELKSYCWDYLVKKNQTLVVNKAKAFLWAIVEPADYAFLKNEGYLGIISDEPFRLM